MAFIEPTSIENFLAYMSERSKLDSIKNMYILPYILLDENGKHPVTIENGTQDFSYYSVDESFESCIKNYLIKSITSFQNLNIKNNKCFCYPYNYLIVSNNVGNQIIYKYEDFEKFNLKGQEYLQFAVEMAITIGGSIRLVPLYHQNKENNYDESLPLAKLPTCSWSGDAFTNWLTQNAVNIGTSIVETTGGLALSVASGGLSAVARWNNCLKRSN